ncbi:MAG: hypothetical protein AAFZ65_06770, partial [Planctomycetota bacterium]
MLRPRRSRTSAGLLASCATLCLLTATLASAGGDRDEPSALDRSLAQAERALGLDKPDAARRYAGEALERDARSIEAWSLVERSAAELDDRDEQVWSTHKQLELAIRQKLPEKEREAIEARLVELDPLSQDLATLRERYVDELLDLAEAYTEEGRRHSAIRTHKEILALDPSRGESETAIEELAAAPDPSLAADAKPADLFADVTEEWIAEHDEDHLDWGDRAKLTRDNYVTQTNAGYEVLVRAAEAMEQMNAFYRQFFAYGTEEHGGSVSRIDLLIYKNRDEYLKIGGNIEWSGGVFKGNQVETFVGSDGFAGMTNTLFHEAAHQFVSLATAASGWLNEGLASFFEGTQILANGTVIMNLPANHRLFPLASRMERGTMEHVNDGIDPNEPTVTPDKAPTFEMVLSGRYTWGPPWYAPTWGLVYFCYNYQHPIDGRFVYRAAFREFINSLSSRLGDSAIEHFEELVLDNPAPPTKGVAGADSGLALHETVRDLEDIWREWILALRDEQSGRSTVERPWYEWAQHAVTRGDNDVAFEQFEKGLQAEPRDVDLLEDFAAFLDGEMKRTDRAAKLQLRAVQLLENTDPVDEKRLKAARKQLGKYDPEREEVEELQSELREAILALVQRYQADGLYLQSMELAQRFGSQLNEPRLFKLYSSAYDVAQRSPAIWKRAYNEGTLEGWVQTGLQGWTPNDNRLGAQNGTYRPDAFDYRFLTYDTVTSGDYSFEADVLSKTGSSAFAGLVFGRKGATDFHALVLFPPKPTRKEGAAVTTYADLTSFRGTDFQTWRHTAVGGPAGEDDQGASGGEQWTTLRIDVVGSTVDAWVDGEFVASQDFGTADVLRGSFGLFNGPGVAEFKEVRYLARSANDPAGAIQRERRIERLMAEGGGLNGSYLNYVPPFPKTTRFAQGDPVDDWFDFGRRPILFSMWSLQSNDLIPIQDWLGYLERKWGDQGLQFFSVVSPNDEEGIDDYLAQKRFPGTIAVDDREGYGIGETFEAFAVDRFNLPRILIIDLDGRVVWEGDPGFSIGQPWDPSLGSYVDEPLKELIERRRLDELLPCGQGRSPLLGEPIAPG